MYFEHADASGVSQRSSKADGTVIETEGFDAAPAELDPLGGNAGLSNPYVEVLPPNIPEPEIPTLQELTMDDMMTVNGRRVPCQLDGFAIGCSRALSMLGNSAEIDFANTSRWLLGRLGISAVYIPGGSNTVTQVDTGQDRGDFTVNISEIAYFPGRWEYYFGGISWQPQVQTPQVQPDRSTVITSRGNTTASKSCNLRIGIANNNLLDQNQLEILRNEFDRIYSQVGVSTEFVSTGADFWVNINTPGAVYTQNANAVGSTFLTTDKTGVTNSGRVFVDRLIASATATFPSRVFFNLNSSKFTAIGLGRAAAHEVGHYVLQQTNDSLSYFGVMRASFSGSEWFGDIEATRQKWRFNLDQARAIRQRLCPGAGSIENPGVPEQ